MFSRIATSAPVTLVRPGKSPNAARLVTAVAPDDREADHRERREPTDRLPDHAGALEVGHPPLLVERVLGVPDDLEAGPQERGEADHEEDSVHLHAVDVGLDLGADHGEPADEPVDDLVANGGLVLQEEAQDRHERDQQREHRDEPVVGEQRGILLAAVVAVLGADRDEEPGHGALLLPRVELLDEPRHRARSHARVTVRSVAMCGRFVAATPPDQLARYFGAGLAETLLPENYNVAPTTDIYAVVDGPNGRELAVFHWGLVPVWAKDIKIGNRMINARAETVATSNAFKHALKKKRCIIPVDGFYEWKATPGEKRKQPYFIHRLDGEPLAFAGLWETWRGADRQAEQTLYSSTIITTSANETMQPIHDRMPVILPASKWDEWLDPKNDDIASLQGLLIPAPAHLLTMHPVSTDVNKVSNKGPHLIDPTAPD